MNYNHHHLSSTGAWFNWAKKSWKYVLHVEHNSVPQPYTFIDAILARK